MSDFGPKLSALTEMQRLFVIHFVVTGGNNGSDSARVAGYSVDRANREAYELLRMPRIIGAIKEETERTLSLDLPGARLALLQVLRNEQHKDHFAAIKLLLGTQGISAINKTEHVHSIDTASLDAQIKMLEAQLPADMRRRLAGPKVIDVTPIQVDTGMGDGWNTEDEDWRAP